MLAAQTKLCFDNLGIGQHLPDWVVAFKVIQDDIIECINKKYLLKMKALV